MTTELALNERVALATLDRAAKNIRVTLSWDLLPDLKNPPEGDIFAFLLDKNNQSPKNEDFIFYNQPDGIEDSVRLSPSEDGTDARTGGVQSVLMDLEEIRYEILALEIGFNLYRAGERDQSMRFVETLVLSVHNETGAELARYTVPVTEYKAATCMTLLKLEREGNHWFLTPLADTSPDFNAKVREHGIVVAG